MEDSKERMLSILEEKVLQTELDNFVQDFEQLIYDINDRIKQFNRKYDNIAMDRNGVIRAFELEKFLKRIITAEVDSGGVRFVIERYQLRKNIPSYIKEKLISSAIDRLLALNDTMTKLNE